MVFKCFAKKVPMYLQHCKILSGLFEVFRNYAKLAKLSQEGIRVAHITRGPMFNPD